MESGRLKQFSYIIAAALLLYVASYVWIRSTSLDFGNFNLWGSTSHTTSKQPSMIPLGLTEDDANNGVAFSPAKLDRFKRRLKLIGTVFQPAAWIDEKITGAEIVTDIEEMFGGF